jgi:HD-GYP domain-containing protein (c-di-GMP phosphodiesterase class II)
LRIVRSHHERLDGRGFPDGLRGAKIPIEARIVAVADAFDAMTTRRPYRESRPPAEALLELRRVAGSQLDPEAVEAFVGAYPSEPASLFTLHASRF